MRQRPRPRSDTRFVEAGDGTRVAWREWGRADGPPLVITHGLANNEFFWLPLIRRLGRDHRIVTWDYRGHGESESARDPDAITIPAMVDDLSLVLGAAGVERAPMLTFSLGCQVVLEAWRRFPERIERIMLAFGTFERPFDNFYGPMIGRVAHTLLRSTPAGVMDDVIGVMTRMAPVSYAAGRAARVIETAAHYGQFRPYFDQLAGHDVRSWVGLALAAQAHSAEDVLATITVPTLVVSGGWDAFAPPGTSARMVGTIPGAEHLFLPRASHTGLLGHAGPIGDALERFLDQPSDAR